MVKNGKWFVGQSEQSARRGPMPDIALTQHIKEKQLDNIEFSVKKFKTY